MRLTLTIENHTNLPDGGPLSFTVTGARGFDIGRDQYLDWTLPDPSLFISGKHCEIRAQGGEYLLYDVSTNGTFVNGADHRTQSPYRLRTGDRLSIGPYLIAVEVEAELGAAPRSEAPARAAGGELWSHDGEMAPPIHPRDLHAPASLRPVNPDFLERASDAFAPTPPAFRGAPAETGAPSPVDDPRRFDWDAAQARLPLSTPEAPPTPTPRRVASPGAGGPWSSPADPVAAASRPFADDAPPSWADPAAPRSSPRAPESGDVAGAPSDEFVRRFAAAAGLPPEALAGADAGELADQLGKLVRSVTGDLMMLMSARTDARRMTRSASHTVIQATDNNALKFSPSPAEALRILFGPPTRSYLPAERAFAQAFSDLKGHQVRTYSAMQQAARRLAEELSPEAVEAALPAEGGLGAVMASRRSRLWDSYVARWKTTTGRHENGLVDVFMLYFTECYDRCNS